MWEQVALGDVITLKRGYDLPSASRRDGQVPIVSSSGVTGFHDEAKVHGPGVVTGRYGTLGRVFFVDKPFWPLNTTLYVQDFKGNDPRFVSYLLRVMSFSGRSVASAVPGVNRNDLHRLHVLRPPLHEQRRIASILSAYDDLIANNTRRIQILEEMAQAIYREWFVEFRFPGHEGVRMVESDLGPIPEGWRLTTWGSVATLEYGRALRTHKGGVGPYPVFGTNGPIGWHDTPLFPAGVIVGRKGAYRGIHLADEACWVIDTAFYLNIREHGSFDRMFAYHCLKTLDVNALDSGSAIPSTTRESFYAQPVVIPPQAITSRFEAIAHEMRALHRTLRAAVTNLRATRDLLLPRLISGEIDVSNLDTGNAEPAA